MEFMGKKSCLMGPSKMDEQSFNWTEIWAIENENWKPRQTKNALEAWQDGWVKSYRWNLSDPAARQRFGLKESGSTASVPAMCAPNQNLQHGVWVMYDKHSGGSPSSRLLHHRVSSHDAYIWPSWSSPSVLVAHFLKWRPGGTWGREQTYRAGRCMGLTTSPKDQEP